MRIRLSVFNQLNQCIKHKGQLNKHDIIYIMDGCLRKIYITGIRKNMAKGVSDSGKEYCLYFTEKIGWYAIEGDAVKPVKSKPLDILSIFENKVHSYDNSYFTGRNNYNKSLPW